MSTTLPPQLPMAALSGVRQSASEAFHQDHEGFDSCPAMGPATHILLDSPDEEGEAQEEDKGAVRAEIDTSAPFESVKEAASRFGGMGFWKPSSQNHKPSSSSSEHGNELVDITHLEEQAVQLEKDLAMKERETFDVLKELEATKMVVEELKANLQKETSEVCSTLNDKDVNPVEAAEVGSHQTANSGLDLCPSSAPGFILLQLKEAKLNLTRTTTDLAEIRATVESYNRKIEKERISLERTRQRLSSNTVKVSSLETELNQTKGKLHLVKCTDQGRISCDETMNMAKEIQKLTTETEEFKKVGEAARSEVSRAMSEIERAKIRIKTAEIRLVAAKKMKEAARASEAVALAEIRALSKTENACSGLEQKPEVLTITCEEYASLKSKAREAEAAYQSGLVDAMLQVDEANLSKAEILKKVEEATEEVKSSKNALEEALSRVESANRGKLAVEEALRKWRSERGQKRRPVHNSTKFKNTCPSHLRKDSSLLDVNGISLVNDELKPVLKPTLSIGQILSRKLLLTEEFENGMQGDKNVGKRKVSLAQMLGKHHGDKNFAPKGGADNAKQLPAKRKKYGFARISILVTKESKKKKKQSATSVWNLGSGIRGVESGISS